MSSLETRFLKFKETYQKNDLKYGQYWEEAKKTFDISFKESRYQSHGSRNYLPFIYNEDQFNSEEIIKVNGKKFLRIGKKDLCITKSTGNLTLLYGSNYYEILEKYIRKDSVCLEVGAGSGLFQYIIHNYKNTKNIIIDIPEVLSNSIALCFTLFPEKKIILPNEISNVNLNLNDYDFVFLSPEQKNIIKKSSIDFCCNTLSFMEMDLNEVNDYILYFNNILKEGGYSFISNRVRKRTYFFSYNYKPTQFKKIFLQKDSFFHSSKNLNLSSTLNLLLIKKEKNYFHFNIIHFVFGISFLKMKELLFWLKQDIKRILRNLIYFYKKSV